MISLLAELTRDKRIVLLGFGREGRSTYNLLMRTDTHRSITVADRNDIPDKDSFNAEFITGTEYQNCLHDYDLIFKSPGIVLENPSLLDFSKITSQTEVFLTAYGKQVVGVTGTKGKSTTTTLIHHILKECGRDTVLVGNIGIPPFDMADRISENTIITYELSCHQLEYTDVSPHIAVLLNTFEEHLDHYGTYENYISAKKNIYRFQGDDDILFCNINNVPESCSSRIVSVSDSGADVSFSDSEISFGERKITFDKDEFLLKGKHNIYNIAVAYAVCSELGISDGEFLHAVKSYSPLPHRLEKFAEIDGVKYFDDSISTACETTIQALDTIKNTGTLLLGGMDRGIDYSPLIKYLSARGVPDIIFMYDSGKRIYGEIQKSGLDFGKSRLTLASDLEEAVRIAKEITKTGECCVLSPAAASYGYFKNFEERGDTFKKYVTG